MLELFAGLLRSRLKFKRLVNNCTRLHLVVKCRVGLGGAFSRCVM